MTTDTTFQAKPAAETALFLGEDWFDPLEAGLDGLPISLSAF